MDCEKIQVLLNDYIDDTLSVSHAEKVNNHCDTCDCCAQQLASLRIQKESLNLLPVPPASGGFKKRVIAKAIQRAQVRHNLHIKT